MRKLVRTLVAPAVVGLAIAAGVGIGSQAQAQQPAQPNIPRVIIIDNNGVFQPAGDANTGLWGYAPAHLTVAKGASIVFDNPAGNFRPHSVTSLTWTGNLSTIAFESGKRFDSSPTREELIQPGSSYTLDTSSLDPGQYVFYCAIHPWMVGTFTLTPAP